MSKEPKKSTISAEQIQLNIAASKARRDVQRAAHKANPRPVKLQAAFASRDEYVGYKRHLAAAYNNVSNEIRAVKQALRLDYRPNGMTYRQAQSELSSLREIARSLMITYEGIKAARPPQQKTPEAYK